MQRKRLRARSHVEFAFCARKDANTNGSHGYLGKVIYNTVIYNQPWSNRGCLGCESGAGGWRSAAATGHSAGQTADGAVKGSAASTDYCCSPNKAFIARMCVHDPKESRVAAVPETSKEPSHSMLFELDQGLSDMSELFQHTMCLSKWRQAPRQGSFLTATTKVMP